MKPETKMKKIIVLISLLLTANPVFSGEDKSTDPTESNETPNTLGQFGFGPAFFVISYDDEVLKDSKDVRLRGDGSINASGSKYSTAIGLEIHYSVVIGEKCRYYGNKQNTPCKDIDKATTSGHSVSPFLGLYDLDNGINGIVAGIVYGYWKGDNKYSNRKSLNVALGKTIHKDQLVLAEGIKEGIAPDANLKPEDYTERKDVKGVVLMISASIGF